MSRRHPLRADGYPTIDRPTVRLCVRWVGIVAVILLSGCITIEMPGVVTDMVKAAKDAYKGSVSDRAEPGKGRAANSTRSVLVHSYAGTGGQTEAEMKQLCVNEAAQKLALIAGKELNYVVLKSEVVTLNEGTFANCELAVGDST